MSAASEGLSADRPVMPLTRGAMVYRPGSGMPATLLQNRGAGRARWAAGAQVAWAKQELGWQQCCSAGQ